MGPFLRLEPPRPPTPPPVRAGELPEVPEEGPEEAAQEEQETVQIDAAQLELADSVGIGGTAEVFRGYFRGQEVAIKQLFRHRKFDARELLHFNREVAILARITHPNLVKFFGITLRERPLRIVTEFCEGGNLFELVHNGTFDLQWAQKHKICADTALGMDYLHGFRPQIIHRDLKSLNLLLERAVGSPADVPAVKVTDFGLSRMKEPGAAWGQMTSQVGTLHWMAPEVFAGSNYDESVDIYSYGMVVFEVVCREVPFEDTDPGIIGQLTMKGVRPDLRVVPEDCPQELRALMVACWAHDAQSRPPFRRIAEAFQAMAPCALGGTSKEAGTLGPSWGQRQDVSL